MLDKTFGLIKPGKIFSQKSSEKSRTLVFILCDMI